MLQAKEYFETGIICANSVVYFLELTDILMLMEIDDSTYHYNINAINETQGEYTSLNERRGVIIARSIDKVQNIVLTTDLPGIKLKYRFMGYEQLLPEINEAFKVENLDPISAATLVRIMREYGIKTLWQRNYVIRSKSGTKYGTPDNRYAAPNLRAILLYRDLDIWNGGKHIHTGNLMYKFQLLSSDIKYHSFGTKGLWVYETIFIDEMTSELVGHHLSDSLRAEDTTIPALESVVANNPNVDFTDTIFNSDHGSQYACKAFYNAVSKLKGLHSMSPAGKPNYNPRAENMFSSISKHTKDLLKTVETYEEACEILRENRDLNNNSRTKKHLGYMTSAQFAAITPLFQDRKHEMTDVYNKILLAA